MLASGLGPFAMGVTFAKTGSYSGALVAMGLALVAAAALILRLGPYAFARHREAGEHPIAAAAAEGGAA